ncbi:MAG TPA: DUF5320 domain-containing protein, partial [Methanomassiliicoccaceae archaeon]|nr:DUF5320 domain-containing protein [Methanomassiliicoccaceae archaeon]
RGDGPRTGRGLGCCEGADVNRGPYRGSRHRGTGRGCGRPRRLRGRTNWLYGPRTERSAGASSEAERSRLEMLARSLEAELEEVRTRLNDLPE